MARNGMPKYEIIEVSGLDSETGAAYKEFRGDFVRYKLRSMLDEELSIEDIYSYMVMEDSCSFYTDSWIMGSSFQGYTLARRNAPMHELGETAAVQYRKSVRFKKDKEWVTNDDPLEAFLGGYVCRYSDKIEERLEYCIKALVDCLSNPGKFPSNYNFRPNNKPEMPRLMREISSRRSKSS